MNLLTRSAAITLLALPGAAGASALYTDSGFAATDPALYFDEVAVSAGDTVTNQFASYGVNFATNGLDQWYVGEHFYDGIKVIPFYLDSISGTDYDDTSAYSILFDFDQSQAGAYFEFPMESSVLFSAYKDGNLLESYVFYNETCCSSPMFLGFADIAFDEIRFGGIDGDDFYMDGLRYSNVVPIPAAIWLFGSGLGLLGWLRRL